MTSNKPYNHDINNKRLLFRKWMTLGLILFAGGVVAFSGFHKLNNPSPKSEQLLLNNQPAFDNSNVIWVNGASSSSSPALTTSVPPLLKQDTSKGKKKIYTLSLDIERTVILRGEVRENALEVASKLNMLAKLSTKPIYLILSGPGGSVIEGSAVIAAIQISRAPVITICDVLCASMDAMIHQYGSQRFMTDRTIIMFHQATASMEGNVDKMVSFATFLKSYVDKIEVDVSARQGLSLQDYKNKIRPEVWIDAEDAVGQHISDGTVLLNFGTNMGLLDEGMPGNREEIFDKASIKKDSNVDKLLNVTW